GAASRVSAWISSPAQLVGLIRHGNALAGRIHWISRVIPCWEQIIRVLGDTSPYAYPIAGVEALDRLGKRVERVEGPALIAQRGALGAFGGQRPAHANDLTRARRAI